MFHVSLPNQIETWPSCSNYIFTRINFQYGCGSTNEYGCSWSFEFTDAQDVHDVNGNFQGNKNYYVVRNAGCTRSRYTLKLSLIFKLMNELIVQWREVENVYMYECHVYWTLFSIECNEGRKK